jgi:hypothetical protein
MKSLFTMLLVTYISNIAYAQRMYRHGYLVNRKGDTLIGQISFDHWKDPERLIFFKKETNDKPFRFSLYEIESVVFPGSDYYRRILDKEGPKMLQALTDGDNVQVYRQMGDTGHIYIGFGTHFLPTMIEPNAFIVISGKLNKEEGVRKYEFKYFDPRLGKGYKVDTLVSSGRLFSKEFIGDLAVKLNGSTNFHVFSPFRPRTHYVPYISFSRSVIVTSGSLQKTWLSPLQYKNEYTSYVEGGIDIYNNWFFKGFRLRLSAGYMAPVTISGQSPSDSARSTLKFSSHYKIISFGTSLLYGRSLGKNIPYAYLGISYKLQILGKNKSTLYSQHDREVVDFRNDLKYYHAGMTPGLRVGLILTNDGIIEVKGSYDWAFLLAYSKSNGYGVFQNVAGIGACYHFSKRPRKLFCQ